MSVRSFRTGDPADLPPRPQFARARWHVLDGRWGFAPDPDDLGVAQGWQRSAEPYAHEITVPFPPESAAAQTTYDGEEVLWYRTEATIDQPGPGRRVLLHFEAVDHAADVWVDGEHVGSHRGGHTPFDLDITHALAGDTAHVIAVRTTDRKKDLEQPRGKQDWQDEPHVIWYRRTSGIWRSVWWEEVPALRVDALTLTPQSEVGAVDLEIRLTTPPPLTAVVEVSMSFGDDPIGSYRMPIPSGRLRAELSLDLPFSAAEPDRFTWTPESPTLIDVEVRLLDDGREIDAVTSYLGLRTVDCDDSSFLLNGRPYPLRLVLEQAYWPTSHLAAPSADALRREAELIKELGFNGLRLHQSTADPRLLFWCDTVGLLVWADGPASYEFSARSLRRRLDEWVEIVERDRNHPSVVTWVPFNESWGLPRLLSDSAHRSAVEGFVSLTHALDPSRPIVGNDGWEFAGGDLLGIHDYAADPAVLVRRYGTIESARREVADGRPGGRALTTPGHREDSAHIPIVLSEFGGTALSSRSDVWSGYGEASTPEALQRHLSDLFDAVRSCEGLAGWCYTQLTDTEQERNGLCDEHRRPKLPIDVLHRIITEEGG